MGRQKTIPFTKPAEIAIMPTNDKPKLISFFTISFLKVYTLHTFKNAIRFLKVKIFKWKTKYNRLSVLFRKKMNDLNW